MTRDDLLKLLGGYATGTLTAEEKDVLFTAALDDQQLFDALADEQALKEMLEDPECRARLLAAAGQPQVVPMPAKKARPRWIVALSIAASVIVIVSAAAIYLNRPVRMEMAVARVPQRMDLPAPVPAQSAPAGENALSELKALKRITPPMNAPRQIAKKEKLEKEAAPMPQPAPAAAARSVTAGALGGVAGGFPGDALSVAVAPAAPPLPSFTQTAMSPDGQLVVHYAVLRRTGDGEYLPVNPQTEFTPSDEIRLRLEANQPGSISVAESGTILFTSAIVPTAMMTTSTLPLNAGQTLEISFDRGLPRPAMAFSASKQKADAARSEAMEAKDQMRATPLSLRIVLPLRVKPQ